MSVRAADYPGTTRMASTFKSVFSFPNPVNEVAARMVAGMVVVLALATILSGQSWLYALLAYGFLARVATGPTLSPMGLLATRVLATCIGNSATAGPGTAQAFRAVGWPGLLNHRRIAVFRGGLNHSRQRRPGSVDPVRNVRVRSGVLRRMLRLQPSDALGLDP